MLQPIENDNSMANLTAPDSFSDLLNAKFYLNLTQVLNISLENLTSLLQSVQDIELQEQQQLHTNSQSLLVLTSTSMSLLSILTVCYALIFIAGILGNLVTCIVISRNNFMHTATNFYLFNLAVSDLILLFAGMPQDLYNLWQPNNYPFTDGICILESVLSETAANATVLTITAFTVERYIAICHPFRQHTMSKLSRAIKFIFAIWIAALLLALPQAIQFSVMVSPWPAVGTSCTMQNDFFAHVFAISGFLFFGGPMTAICLLYVLIGVKLKRSRLLQVMPRRAYDIQRGISAQTRIIRMLVAVAVAFFICWAPFHAQRLMAVYGSTSGIDSQIFNDVFNILTYTSGVLYFLSTCINPLLYNIMSHKFREAFKVTLSRHFRLKSKYQSHSQPHHYSALRRNPTGSLRLQTTVNSNQDSVRTTMTTTTMMAPQNGSSSGGCGGGNSRGSQRLHRISLDSSHAPMYNSISRPDLFAARTTTEVTAAHAHPPPHRMLQTQISQLSSDAHSLLEADADGCVPANDAYRSRRRDIKPATSEPAIEVHTAFGEKYEITACHGQLTPISAIAKLGISQPAVQLTRSTRLTQNAALQALQVGAGGSTSIAVGHEANGKVQKLKIKKTLKTTTTLKSFKAKFNWRTRRKTHMPQEQHQQRDSATVAHDVF